MNCKNLWSEDDLVQAHNTFAEILCRGDETERNGVLSFVNKTLAEIEHP